MTRNGISDSSRRVSPIKDSTAMPPFGFYKGPGPNALGAIVSGNTNDQFTLAGDTSGWRHYALVYDGLGSVFLYVDGALQHTSKCSPLIARHKLRLGAIRHPFRTGATDGMTGYLDEVRVWNYARSSQEIGDYMKYELLGKEPGLLVYYNCNQGVADQDNKDGTSLLNLADFTNNGVLNGFREPGSKANFASDSAPVKPARSAKLPGMALSFDGVDDFLISNKNLPISGAAKRTIEFWAKLDSVHNMRYFLSYGKVDAQGNLSGILHNNGTLHFHGHYADLDTGYRIDLRWHHYAFTYDGATLRAFVDGAPTPNPSKVIQLKTTASPLCVGANTTLAYGTAMNFFGEMAELRVWDHDRSASQIAQLMYSRGLSDKSLILYYPFQQGKAYEDNSAIKAVTDKSANNNDAPLSRFALNGAMSNFVPFGSPRGK